MRVPLRPTMRLSLLWVNSVVEQGLGLGADPDPRHELHCEFVWRQTPRCRRPVGIVEGGDKRLGYIFAVTSELRRWLAVDVRKVAQLGGMFARVSVADKHRMRTLGEAIARTLSAREALAWARSAPLTASLPATTPTDSGKHHGHAADA